MIRALFLLVGSLVLCYVTGILLTTPLVLAGGPKSEAARNDELRQQVEQILSQDATQKLQSLGPSAIPHLVALYKDGKYRKEILPVLTQSKQPEGRRAIEEALLAETSNDEIYLMAQALGTINQQDSKPVLIKKLRGFSKSEPSLGGITFGGSSDMAHLGLIWALARLEGHQFGSAENHVWRGEDAMKCLEWWRKNRARFGIK